jgi:hypothetical protein
MSQKCDQFPSIVPATTRPNIQQSRCYLRCVVFRILRSCARIFEYGAFVPVPSNLSLYFAGTNSKSQIVKPVSFWRELIFWSQLLSFIEVHWAKEYSTVRVAGNGHCVMLCFWDIFHSYQNPCSLYVEQTTTPKWCQTEKNIKMTRILCLCRAFIRMRI